MWAAWLECVLWGISIPSCAVSVVWERARKILYGQTLTTLYNALIKPHFIYCITIWGNTCKKYLNKVHLIQKKVIRIITFSEFSAHTAPLLEKLGILNIYQIVEYFVGRRTYREVARICEVSDT